MDRRFGFHASEGFVLLNTACNLCYVGHCNGTRMLICAYYFWGDRQIVLWLHG
uniref:Uncharacterized protein n=1 Tax=Arundo donax TaxID=35708 RepID=A0A0A8ZKH0_ARUDO